MSCASRGLFCALLAVTAGLLALHFGSDAEGVEQPTGLWLPWEAGHSWRLTNGPHGSSSDGFGAALDFQPADAAGRACDGSTSASWVVAAAGGRVHNRLNGLEIDHGNGFRTGYLHLQEKQVTSGSVDAGDRLGRVSCCPEGDSDFCWATAPHLHFYTVFRGARQGILGVNLEGWVVQDDGCLARGDERACVGGWLKSGAPAQSPSNADVVLIIDATGDNQTGDPQRVRLAAARAFLAAAGPDDRVGIVAYNSTVHAATKLRTVKGEHGMDAALLHRIDRVGADGKADLRVGLRAGCRQLIRGAVAEAKAAVLISDGVHDFRQMGEPQRCLKQHGWPLYAVAVAPGSEETLRSMAEDAGGAFINLTGVPDIACEMHRLRMMISEQTAGACKTEPAFVDKTALLAFEVPEGQAAATFTASWLRLDAPSNVSRNARVAMTLISPSGRSLGPNTVRGDLTKMAGDNWSSYTLALPQAGLWSVKLTGVSVPGEGIPVTVSLQSTVARPVPLLGEPQPEPSPSPAPEEAPPEATPTETPSPTSEATSDASPSPTPEPTTSPSPNPSATPTPEPSPTATPEPTPEPTPTPPP